MSTPAAPKGTARIDPLVGCVIAGKYKILKKIGEGGMGSVYIATQEPIDRKVAIKVLLGKLAEDEVAVKRFEQEARAISKMQHPNTVTIYDFGKTEDERLYIVMEFLKGRTLTLVLRQDGVLQQARACKIIRQVCGSLADAHAAGIIHRDLKPDNIFLSAVGGDPDWVKVLDFGVAKLANSEGAGTLTQTGMIFGTPKYMSPEQAEGRPIDYRADIYALGVVLYELLVGRPPFVADTPVGLLLKHISEPPAPFSKIRPDLHIDGRLEMIVMKALEKHPDRRHQVVGELAHELAAFERAITGPTPMLGYSTIPNAIPGTGLPTEVIPGTMQGSPVTPADLRPPNQVPGNLSLSVPPETREVGPASGMRSGAGTNVATAQIPGQGPTAIATAQHTAQQTAQGVRPFASQTTPIGFTHALTKPIPAPGGGVDTLGGIAGDLSAALRPPAPPKTKLLAGGVVLLLGAVSLSVFALRGGNKVESLPLEPSPQDVAKAPVKVAAEPPAKLEPGPANAVEEPTKVSAEIKDMQRPPPGRQNTKLPTPRDEAEKPAVLSRNVTVTIESTPSGATVEIDGRQAGVTPFRTDLPRDGVYSLTFNKAGFRRETQTVPTTGDKSARSVNAELQRLAEPEAKSVVKTPQVKKPAPDRPRDDDEKVDDLK